MSQLTDDLHRQDQEQDALLSLRHYTHDELGNVPGAVFAKDRYVSVCCDAKPWSVYVYGTVRQGTCTRCGEFSTLKLIL